MWLGVGIEPWADVNLHGDHKDDVLAAVRAFQALPGPHKVSGSARMVAQVRSQWQALFDAGEVWLDPANVSWMER
jgi:hypothetical protein